MNISPLEFGSELLLLLSSGFGFIYGAKDSFKKGKALFVQIIVCSLGCLALGKLFSVLNMFMGSSANESFNVGMLGIIGCFIFLFSASFGQMDGLVDSRDKSLMKYRLISMIPPAVILLCYIPILLSPLSNSMKVIYGIYFIMLILVLYYNVKHIVFPDVEFGILRSIRNYNITAVIFTLLNTLQLIFMAYDLEILTAVARLLISVVCVALYPILINGVKKWEM